MTTSTVHLRDEVSLVLNPPHPEVSEDKEDNGSPEK